MDTKIYLNQEHIKQEVISRCNYDPDTGKVTWAFRDESIKGNKWINNNIAGKVVGKVHSQGYDYLCHMVSMELCGRRVNLVVARIAWLCMTGDWPKHTIDHINMDSTDHRWENLRDVPQGINNTNRKGYKCNKLNQKGVYKRDNKFYCIMTVSGKQLWLGSYNTFEEAKRVYQNKEAELSRM